MTNITLTARAAEEVRRTMVDQGVTPETVYLRAAVAGGGCSGFQWKLVLDEEVNATRDMVQEVQGLRIVVDKRSALYLDGTTVDFHEDLNKRGFVFSNPGIKSTCGCGSSFSM